MEQLMYEEPFTFWAIGYGLMIVWVWFRFCEDLEVSLHKLPLTQMLAAIFWPLFIAFSLLMFIVIGTLMLIDWIKEKIHGKA